MYRDNPALNQSFLKCFDSYEKVKYALHKSEQELEKEVDKGYKLGLMVDTIITDNDNFDNIFYLSDIPKPTKTQKDLVDKFVELHPNEDMMSFDLVSFCKEHKFWSNLVDEEKISEKVNADEIISYYLFLKETKTKYFVTQEEIDLAKSLVELFKTSYTKDFFEHTTHYQLELYGKIDGIDSKGLLDMVIKNDSDKTIQIHDIEIPPKSILPMDMKVTTLNPLTAIKKFKYNIQAAWYFMLLRTVYPEYRIFNPVYLFASPSWDYTLWYEFDSKEMIDSILGTDTMWGIDQYLEMYKKYERNGYLTQQHYENGEITDRVKY